MIQRSKFALAVMALVVAACGGDSFPGSLEAVIDPGGETSGFGDFTSGTSKSFGIFVCTNGGALKLTSIDAVSVSGGVKFLGGEIYTSPDMFVGAADGYPTDGLDSDRLQPLQGAVIETDCDDPDGEDRVQIIVGAERTSVTGGMIEGIEVGTSDGPVVFDYTILLCGDELEFCEFLAETGA